MVAESKDLFTFGGRFLHYPYSRPIASVTNNNKQIN